MTCEVNAGVNYEAYFGEFSNSTINAIFESIMASLDGNYGGRDSTLTYTLINFVRRSETPTTRNSIKPKVNMSELTADTKMLDLLPKIMLWPMLVWFLT